MPGHQEAKKDAANGETHRGAVSTQRSGDIRMGEPVLGIGHPENGGERRELKHLSTCRRRKKIDSVSSGERKRRSPNRIEFGVIGATGKRNRAARRNAWEGISERVRIP